MSMQKKSVQRTLGALLMTTTAMTTTTALAADDGTSVLPGIVVEGQSLPAIISTDVRRGDIPPAADGGSFLKSIPGIDAVRMGGHGLDPVIRGQQQEQLNVISDGAFIFGGCPSRMDPPAALSSIDTFDSVTVEKGFQSVRHGPGGSGGTVILERKAPVLDDAKPYRIRAGAAVNSNGGGVNGNLDVAGKVASGYVRAQGTKGRASNYEDGNGKEVRSAYKQWSSGLELGWTPGNGTELSLSAERDKTNDILFAGTGMDSPYGVTDVVRVKFAKELDGATVKAVRINAYGSYVDHLMDNYSLRDVGNMWMRTPTSSDTTGFKAEADLNVADMPVLVGVDYKNLDRTGIRYGGMNATKLNTVQSYVWPGVESREVGVYGEGTMALGAQGSLKAGLRYDNVHVTAGLADELATYAGASTRSANQLYTAYYGYGFSTVTEHNVSGLLRYETKLSEDSTLFTSVSRSVRTANTTERTMAADMGNASASSRRVGNPHLDPEQHYQVDVGMDTTVQGWSVSGTAYYDYVHEFIFRDVARGQDGMPATDGATVYRNIDATLAGFDLSAQHTFANQVSLNGSLSYTYGQNEESNNALPQIPPLKLGMDVSYPAGDWLVGTRVNAAMKQTRVDDDSNTGSGRDVGKTSGYVTADLYASRLFGDSYELGLGVTNLFDKTYANHLNKSNSFDTTEVQVNEPGRSFYFRVTGEF